MSDPKVIATIFCNSCETAEVAGYPQAATGVCDECAQDALLQKLFEIADLEKRLASMTAERDEWRSTAQNAMSPPSSWEKGAPF